MTFIRFLFVFLHRKNICMGRTSHKIEVPGGIISTTDMTSEAEYKRIYRAAQRLSLIHISEPTRP